MTETKLLRGLRGRDVIDVPGAVAKANEVLDVVGILSVPVPVEKIARKLGVQIRYAPFDGEISGMAHIRDGVSVIGVNNLHHPNRQRFTLSHELGHLLLHPSELERQVHLDRGSLYRDAISAEGTNLHEITANAFASELLMPRRLIDSVVEAGVDLEDEEHVARLARRFRVSMAAMYFRLSRRD